MCGINFIIDKTKSLGKEPIAKMNSALDHRGPDNSAFQEINTEKERLYFGSTRLKIIDKSDAANQPLQSNGGHLLIYNGEIYNYQDLKNDLISNGVRFNGNSDSETLLHHLSQFGQSGINGLNGMFAFVFFNENTNEILLARDRQGMKPLFYYEDEKYFIASSEIKGIFASGLVEKKLNESQVQHYLSFRHAAKPATFYQNIFELEEGVCMTKDGSQAFVQTTFTQPRVTETPSISPDDMPVKAEEILTGSLLRHLISDVPVGLFLSGGVDSTLLLALAQKQGISIPSFSILNSKEDARFGTEDYRFAKKAAQQYGSQHTTYEVSVHILDNFDKFISQIDQPIGDSAELLTYFLSEKTKEKVTVVLSGAGADELFAGYHRHAAFQFYLKHKKLLVKTARFVKSMVNHLPSGQNIPLRKQLRLIQKFVNAIHTDPKQTFLQFANTAINPNLSAADYRNKKSFNEDDLLGSALEYDRSNYLISDVLALNDRACMQNSVEMRMPYLDQELVAFAESLPSDQLLLKGRKWILKEILEKHGGKEYATRPKEGFGLPIGNWIRKGQVESLLGFVENKKHFIFKFADWALVKAMLKAHKQGTQDNTLQLWSLLILAKWLEKEFAA